MLVMMTPAVMMMPLGLAFLSARNPSTTASA